MVNASMNQTQLCEEAKIILGTYQMKTLLILQCIFGAIALFPNVLTIILLLRIKVFHLNLRVLLLHLSIDSTVFSVTLAEKAFQRLLTPVCDLPVLSQTCVMRQWAVMIPLHNSMVALVILFLERLYSTIRFRTYDKSTTRPYLAVVLLLCSWTSTLCILVTTYRSSRKNIWVPLCETIFTTGGGQVLAIVAAFVTLEVAAIGLMIFVYTYNRFTLRRVVMNRAQFDLSARFQIDQNVNVNAALLPSAVLHVICYLPAYSSILSAFVDFSVVPVKTKTWILHLTYTWRLVYAIVHPSLLIVLNPNLRKGFYKTKIGQFLVSLSKRKILSKGHGDDGSPNKTDAHFEYLSKMWDASMMSNNAKN